MKKSRGRVVEIDSVAELERRLASGARSLSGWHLHGVDLSRRAGILDGVRVAGALFLGCTFAAADEADLRERGAVIFPAIPEAPVDTYRAGLYSPAELYDTPAYDDSFDARVYAYSKAAPTEAHTLVRAMHDRSIDEALGIWAGSRNLVGVMGGHRLERGDKAYAAAARLGQGLSRARVVATGGGPGAMEAANLGAWFAHRTPEELDAGLATLATVPAYRPDVSAWARVALDVLDRFPGGAESLGIPTWFYGHEPSNPFATSIAKYFANPTREAILLQVCDAGIVFLPGAAGTVQEIFQDACENYYADESSVAPMVLVGVDHWTQQVPAWPLLSSLARGRPMEEHVHLVDTVNEAIAIVTRVGGA